MRYAIDQTGKKTVYIQLYEQLRQDIVEGIYRYGDRLPSKRLLAEETGVSLISVEHAYSLLCDEGYAEASMRRGYFVAYRESDGFAATESVKTPPLDMIEAAQTDFPFSTYARTVRRVLSEYGEQILQKCPNKGSVELREAIARYLARSRHMTVDAQQIVIGSGSEYLYGLIIQMLSGRRIYAIEKPSYEKIEQIYRANGVTYEMLALGAGGIRSDELERTSASVLHITPYRSFPSGITASAAKRREYLNWAAGGDRLIIEDDYESEFSVSSKPEDTVFALSDADNVLYVNTFSKTVAPSIRVGYLILPKSLLPLFDKRVGLYSCTVPTFEQYVLTQFINEGDFERHINRVRRQKRKALNGK